MQQSHDFTARRSAVPAVGLLPLRTDGPCDVVCMQMTDGRWPVARPALLLTRGACGRPATALCADVAKIG